jgi:hypothetical protein
LSDCNKITDKGYQYLKKLKSLKQLDLHSRPKITDNRSLRCCCDGCNKSNVLQQLFDEIKHDDLM